MPYFKELPSVLLCLLIVYGKLYGTVARGFWDFGGGREGPSSENWNGRWFPFSPSDNIDRNPVVEFGQRDLYDPHHGVVMGKPDPRCDDGKTRLHTDWDMNPLNYTCFDFARKLVYKPHSNVQPVYTEEHIPKGYSAQHKCMDQSIHYDRLIPTFGPHRPLWAKYGEYTFLPRQRWIHNLEHGAIVMLYHPCANKNEVRLLRKLVTKCLYRHIITPYNLMSAEYPLALVAWGKKLEMSEVSPDLVIKFIKKNALSGPEQTARDGQYNLLLEEHASVVSDINDSNAKCLSWRADLEPNLMAAS